MSRRRPAVRGWRGSPRSGPNCPAGPGAPGRTRRSMPAPVRPEIPAFPPIKKPGNFAGPLRRNALSMKRYLAADFFEVLLDDFRAVDFFVPALAEREALDFLAPDFEELERAFEDDLLVVAGDLAMTVSFHSPLKEHGKRISRRRRRNHR